MKRMIRFAAAFVAGAVLFAAHSLRAESYNDGTYTWEWNWNDDRTGVVLRGNSWWDGSNSVYTAGISPAPEGKVVMPATVETWEWSNEAGIYMKTERTVTGIGYHLFHGCDKLTEVILPDTVAQIGDDAFTGCTSLESVNVPASLKSCSAGAFLNSGWWNARTNEEFLAFGPSLFTYQGTNETVTVPDGTVSIAYCAFYGDWRITSVEIPESVKKIGDYAFGYCRALTNVVFKGDMSAVAMNPFRAFAETPWLEEHWDEFPRPENDAFDDAIELTGESGQAEGTNVGATRDDDGPLLSSYESASVWWKWTAETDGEITFTASIQPPDTGYAYSSLIVVYANVYADAPSDPEAGTNEVAVSTNTVDAIEIERSWGYARFEATAGTTYYIGIVNDTQGAVSLDWYRYRLYTSRWSTDGGEQVSVYGYTGTLPETLVLPDDITSISYGTFYGASCLTNVVIPAGVTWISDDAFMDCQSLAEVEFAGDDIAEICNPFRAFAGTPWLEEHREGLPTPENDDFADATAISGASGSIEGTNVGATREENDPLADFSGYDNTVWWKWTADADGAIGFAGWIRSPDATGYYNSNIGVYTASSVTNADGSVATNMEGEAIFTLTPVAEEGWRYVTFEAEAGTTYYVEVAGFDSGTVELYWYRGYMLVEEDGVVTDYCGELPETLDIPEGVTAIANWVFYGDEGIRTVNLPSSLQSIGEEAFACCYALETVNGLTDGVEVDPTAFRYTPYSANRPFRLLIEDGVLLGFEGICPAVVEVPEGVTAIAGYAFSDGDNGYGSEVTVTNMVEVFVGTNADGSVIMELQPQEETEWVWHSLVDGLTEVRIPASVTEIGEGAFAYCTNLATVAIANPGVKIDWTAFRDCTSLASAAIQASGYAQTGWALTFTEPAYATWTATNGQTRGELAYGAGDSILLALDDLSFLTDGVTWSGEEGQVLHLQTRGAAYVTAVGEFIPDAPPDLFETEQTDAFEGDAQYTGWLRDADGNLVGTVTVKAGKPNKKTKAVKLTATVVMLANGKKQTFSGTATAGQLANVTLSGKSGSMNVTLSDDAVTGTYGAYTIEAAKNVFTSKDSGDKANAKSVAKRNWTVTLASAKGYTAFTLAVAAKGKAKVTGVLPDGTKVSVSAQAVVGDGGRWAVPVMFAKKSKFGFVAWFDANGFTTVSDLTPLKGPKGAVTEWEAALDACGPVGSLAAGAHAFAVDAESVVALLPAVNAELLPTAEEVKVAGNKWTLAKAAKVAYKGGAWTVTPGAKGGAVANASGAKLTFTPKTGTFKGSFTAYSVKGGRLVKTKFTVNGAVVNGVAYGTAFNKTAGSVPLAVQ